MGMVQHSIPTEQLRRWYVDEGKTSRQISALLGISQPWAAKLMRERGIPMRKTGDWSGRPKGSTLTEEHKARIGAAHIGIMPINPDTGRPYNDKRIEVPCTHCGKLVLKRKWFLDRYKPFCDQVCQGAATGEKSRQRRLEREARGESSYIAVPCLQCGAEVTRLRAVASKRRTFCSRTCSGRWKSENLNGAKIYNFNGGHDDYRGPNWRAQRHAARVRDNYTCQRCGVTREEKGKNPDVHHIIRFREFGMERYKEANALSNLICYCNTCHKIVEETT